jgi:hypothetical protein
LRGSTGEQDLKGRVGGLRKKAINICSESPLVSLPFCEKGLSPMLELTDDDAIDIVLMMMMMMGDSRVLTN